MVRDGDGRVDNVEGRSVGVRDGLEEVDETVGVGLDVPGTLGLRVDDGRLLVGVGVGFNEGVGLEEGGVHVRRVDEGFGVNLEVDGLGVNLEDDGRGVNLDDDGRGVNLEVEGLGVNLEEVRTGSVNLEDVRTVFLVEELEDTSLVDGTGGVNLDEVLIGGVNLEDEDRTLVLEDEELEGPKSVDGKGGVNLEEEGPLVVFEEMTVEFEVGNGGTITLEELEDGSFVEGIGGVNLEED